ncbi:hypothetical protein OH540_07655 [Streptomyces sp. BPPL-273]|uniref:hypothetical protein n=1 Tax=Streptomyces TaxID=1883 RepID=UPI0024AFB443|nr:hypothetical protein [Streptomyces sp. BPPL-273]WHM29907.1 hypothetical protein OH540_07655 [Streptomyces sp. BPPL-273]
MLLPLAGHVLAQCHAPRWIIVAGMAAVAVPGAAVLTRNKLTDAQLLAVFGAAQLAYHAAYSLPGACAAVTADEPGGGLSRLVEHDAVTGPPAGVLMAGHLVALVLAVRLLGLGERLLWQSRALLTVVQRLVVFLWPLLRGRHGCGPQITFPDSSAPMVSALLVRLHEGRAPPRHGRSPFAVLRPMPIGGPSLP